MNTTSQTEAEPRQLRAYALLSICLFVAFILPWSFSDLWYDEVVTLGDFIIGPSHRNTLLHTFYSYPVANNHILFSAVGWLWVRLTNYNLSEMILRLPSMLFGILMLLTVLVGWSRWLGRRVSIIAAFFLAVSPVIGAFAFQLRGYSLSLFLATLMVTGTMHIADGSYRRGMIICMPVAFLLPLVIPTNVVLAGAHLLFLLWWSGNAYNLRQRLLRVLPVAAALLLGCLHYLTIWPQFMATLRKTSGWDSSWMVAANIFLGWIVLLGPMVGVYIWQSLRFLRTKGKHDQDCYGKEQSLRLFACAVIGIAALLLMPGRTAPFPRNFVVFLPTLTFCTLLGIRRLQFLERNKMIFIVGLIVFHGFLWLQVSSWMTDRLVADGRRPQNLILQYYRGDSSMSAMCRWLLQQSTSEFVFITDAYDLPAFRYYLHLFDVGEIAVYSGSALAEDEDAAVDAAFGPLAVLAVNEIVAAQLFSMAGAANRPFRLAHWADSRGLYVLASQ